MRSRLPPPAIVLAALLATPALAAEPARRLDEVPVEALRETELPKAVEIDETRLRSGAAASSDVARLLADIPGISLYAAGGVSSLPAIHGLADDRVRIKLDGMDLVASCPNHMNPPLSYLAPSQVGRARVYAGISPVSVGGDSLAGSIVVDTLEPRFGDPDAALQADGSVGSHYRSNGRAWGIDLRANAVGANYQLSYSGAIARAGNYRAGGDFRDFEASGRPGHRVPLDEVGSTAYETRNHQIGLALRFEDQILEARFGYQDMPYQRYPNQRMDLVDNQQTRVNLRYQRQREDSTLDVRVYHEDVGHRMDFGADKRFWYGADSLVAGNPVDGQACAPISATCAAGMPMLSDGRTDGAALKLDLSLDGRDQLRGGLELQAYRLDERWPASGSAMWPGGFINIHDGKRDRVAVFGEWERHLASGWTTLAGLRYEQVGSDAGPVRGYDVDAAPPGSYAMTAADAAAFNARDRHRHDDNLDLTLLGRHAASEWIDLEFGFARKTRSPNLYERYTWSSWSMAAAMNNFVGDGNGYVGDIGLDPEVAHTLSASLDWHDGGRERYLTATPYLTDVQDYIDAVRLTQNPGQFNVLRFANQRARLYGLDLSAGLPLAESAFGRSTLEAVLNYTVGENRDSGDALYNIMPLNARIALRQQRGRWTHTLEWELVDAKDDTSAVRNEIATAGYGLLHLRSQVQWSRVRIDLGIDNLFDRLHALPLGGAYLGQGRTMMLTGVPYGIAVPGMGRSLHAGIRIDF